jgi:hypothetical protein
LGGFALNRKETQMNIYFAVFNARDPELRKARIAFNKKFGKGSYAKHIAPFVRKGIMSIFKVPPTPKTKWYVELVAQLVNARVGEAG